jgi:hypothetical protein
MCAQNYTENNVHDKKIYTVNGNLAVHDGEYCLFIYLFVI